MKPVAGAIAQLGAADIARLQAGETLTIEGESIALEHVLIVQESKGEGAVASSGEVTVELDTTITPSSSSRAWLARSSPRYRAPASRRRLEVEDRIRLSLKTESDVLGEAIATHGSMISAEVLAVELTSLDVEHTAVKAGGEAVEIGLAGLSPGQLRLAEDHAGLGIARPGGLLPLLTRGVRDAQLDRTARANRQREGTRRRQLGARDRVPIPRGVDRVRGVPPRSGGPPPTAGVPPGMRRAPWAGPPPMPRRGTGSGSASGHRRASPPGLRRVVHERVDVEGGVGRGYDAVRRPPPLLEDPLEELRHDALSRRGGMQIVEEVLGEVSGLIRLVCGLEDGRHVDVGSP